MLVPSPMAYQSEIEKLEARYRENPQQWFAALADSYRKAGDLELALDVVRAGLEKRPNYVSGHIVLGRCLLDQKNDLEAAQAFQRVLELDAENVIALKALAEISRRAGDVAQSRRWLSRLLEVDPMNDEAREALEALGPEVPAAVAGDSGTMAEPEAAAAVATETMPVAEPEAPPVLEIERASVAEPEASAGVELEPAGVAEPEAPPAVEPEAVSVAEPETPPAVELEPVSTLEPQASAAVEPKTPRDLEPDDALGAEAEAVASPDLVAELEPMEFTPPAETPPPAEGLELAGDLPLILPEEIEEPVVQPAGGPAVEEEAIEAAPAEPVVTETMAEVYAQQGLVAQARDIYRELVAHHPEDARLVQRLAELEGAAPGEVQAAPKAKIPLAEATGGESVREFLSRILGGGPAGRESSPPPEVPVEIPGSPTRAAEDEISLAALFGEEPAPLLPKPAEPGRPSSSSFSFDEFFGSQSGGGTKGKGLDAPGGDEGDDFIRWLKSLKS